ncbi:polysulfide reductase NrfD [candidate division KSB1 bacterium]|nr:polysulfide reductase NrfD [candidate division KSB1 bacterium]
MDKENYFAPALTAADINSRVAYSTQKPGVKFYLAIALFLAMIGFGAYCLYTQITTGMGVAGMNNPVAWGIYLTNFVFWVGIAHSGTLISAILFLFRSRWRTSVNRIAEAMTVFAVMMAGLFPLIHLGRIWFCYWLFPYPNARTLWVNFRSPLNWDVFAVSTYMTVSTLFFIVGMIPDMAVLRDRFTGVKNKIYGIFAMGWRGTHKQWHHYETAYMLFAALATPLVISVHSIVSWDFAMSILPGWHSTIFAPYFVSGAIFSGCAMVITILYPLRKIFKLEDLITKKHFTRLAQMMLLTSLIVSYSYLTEFFIAWYSNNNFEQESFLYRAFGYYGPYFWIMLTCNMFIPLTIFFKKIRTNVKILFIISIFVNIGMWMERFVIIITSLARDFDPYAWGQYSPTHIEWGIFIGSFGGFLLLFFSFVKFAPVVAISEVKGQIHHDMHGGDHD